MSNALLDEGVPFRVLDSMGFWDRLEVKDLMAFLRLAANPCSDSMALDRIIAKPARAIGAKAKKNLRMCAAVQNKQLTFEDPAGAGPAAHSLYFKWATGVTRLPACTPKPLYEGRRWADAEAQWQAAALGGATAGCQLRKVQCREGRGTGVHGSDVLGRQGHLLHKVLAKDGTVLAQKAEAAAVDVAMLGARYAAYVDGDGESLERIDQLKRLCSDPSKWLAATPTLDDIDSPNSLDDSLNSSSPGASGSSSSPCDPSLPMLRAFLEHAQLLHDDQPDSSADSKGSLGQTKQSSGEKVQLMTMHASKGKEYKVVFILGFEEGFLPSSMNHNVQGGLGEEKRLVYTGCSRAMELLYLMTAMARPAVAIDLPAATAIDLPAAAATALPAAAATALPAAAATALPAAAATALPAAAATALPAAAATALPAVCATSTGAPADATGLQQHVLPLLLPHYCMPLHASPLSVFSSC
ncbi:DNA helicase [Haematococcus lacustris]|uniref:DNA helicase n=1 Tax=Haematococcus lacustris TaxID=44745 RepID=A0A699ZVD1_HAELA|nr:DNA helicase [Haematococcus lacustris]